MQNQGMSEQGLGQWVMNHSGQVSPTNPENHWLQLNDGHFAAVDAVHGQHLHPQSSQPNGPSAQFLAQQTTSYPLQINPAAAGPHSLQSSQSHLHFSAPFAAQPYHPNQQQHHATSSSISHARQTVSPSPGPPSSLAQIQQQQQQQQQQQHPGMALHSNASPPPSSHAAWPGTNGLQYHQSQLDQYFPKQEQHLHMTSFPAPAPSVSQATSRSPTSMYSGTSGSSLASALDFTAKVPSLDKYASSLSPAASHLYAKEKSPPTLGSLFTKVEQPLVPRSSIGEDQVEAGSEPGTPPLLTEPPKQTKAPVRQNAGSILMSKARSLLEVSAVTKDPQGSSEKLIGLLSESDGDGKFRRPRSTTGQQRLDILTLMDRACAKEARTAYLESWISSPAGRAILGSWLKQAIPPKSSGIQDLSVEYRRTLIPLLMLIQAAPVKLVHLQDEVGLGKIVTGVSKRAPSASAREQATALKEKWSKLVKVGGVAASTSSAAASKSSTQATTNKRPAPSALTVSDAGSAAKKLKAGVTPVTGFGTAKPTMTAAAKAGAGKGGLSFFATSSTKAPAPSVKRTTGGQGGASAKGSASSAAAATSARNDVMSFIDRIDRPAAAKEDMTRQQSSDAKLKGKKSVRWKEDSELVMVKLIEPAIYADDDEHEMLMAKGVGGLDHEEGSALRHAHEEMSEAIDWYSPRELVLDDNIPMRSADSAEARAQEEREKSTLVVTYVEGEEPPSPDETLALQDTQTAHPDLRSESTEMTLGGEIEPFHFSSLPITSDEYSGEADGGSSVGVPVADLLAKLKPAMGSQAADLLHSAGLSTTSDGTSTSAAGAAPGALGGNLGMLQSILQNAKASSRDGASQAAPVTGAGDSSSAPSPSAPSNVSALLASLTALTGKQHLSGAPATGPEASAYWTEASEDGGYWARMYRNQDGQQSQQGQQGQHIYGQQTNYQPQEHGYGRTGGWGGAAAHDQAQQNQLHKGPGAGWARGWNSKIGTVPCKWYKMGTCRYGDHCNFRHGD